MPHCIVEHSAGIDGMRIVPLVFSGALASGLFAVDGGDIKVRAIAFDHCLTGPRQADFVHVTLRILSGRAAEQKQALAHSVLARLDALELRDASLTVEVVDIDRASYAKRVLGA